MDLYNPYEDRVMEASFPVGLGIAFGICLLLLIASLFLILIKDKREEGRYKQIPDWAFVVAYPALYLTLPFVLVVMVMLIFPCWWQNC